MRTAPLFALMVFLAASVCMAEGPPPLEGGSLPEPGGFIGRSVPGFDEAPPSFDAGQPDVTEYYNQRMHTVEGVITAIDLEGRTISINDGDGETEYAYDELTRFQVRLNPIEPSGLKVGSKMAGLHRIKDGAPYIGRVVIMAPSKKKRRR